MKHKLSWLIAGILLLTNILTFSAMKQMEKHSQANSELYESTNAENKVLKSINEELNEQLLSTQELNVLLEAYKTKVTCGNYELTYYNETGNRTYTGTVPMHLKTIAVDPNVIPLGSRVMIEGYEGIFIAEDTGGAVKGNIVDVFYSGTNEELIQLGRQKERNVCIYE